MSDETQAAAEPTRELPPGSEEFELPISGETVVVRSLTGLEVALISKQNGLTRDDPDDPSGTAIQIGFVVCGERRVPAARAAGIRWLTTHDAGDFTALSDKLEALSGYGKGAQKRSVDRAAHDG